ncbi:LytR/AlgR family response regulator transcription factor [Emticicia sp. 17c]|uniref:LytR/AlgR family response regulator transcription factor n=1 Tax=Emticicia sp. 17c TaxID=3127704 RepID=UPI00301CC3E0
MVPFDYSEIVYLEADINYTIFHFYNGKKSISPTTLKKNADKENLQHFLRIHRSFLLNPFHIIGLRRNGKKISVQMTDGTELEVSRRRKPLVKHLKKQIPVSIV